MYERRIESSVIKMMKELKRFQVLRRVEIQEVEKKLEPSASQRDEAVTRLGVKECDLKKQTQYVQARMDVTSLMQEDYENNPAGGVEENKANQSQSHEPEPTKGAGKRKKSLAAATSLTG